MTELKNFRLALTDARFIGAGLRQPECVLAESDGVLWISDKGGAVVRIAPDGSQRRLGAIGGEPNGLALDRQGRLLVANLADGCLYRLQPDGRHEVLLREIDGQPLGAVNFPLIDSRDRVWLSVTSRRAPWFLAAADPQPDGYIVLLDANGARVVADGFYATNELRFDAREDYLYVAETMARRVLRFRVTANGDLREREVFGPADLGPGGYVDGIAFDAQGNLWLAMVMRNGLWILGPDGEPHVAFEEPNEPALAHFAARIAAGALTPEDFFAAAGKIIQFPTSVAFAGPDLRMVYMGSLLAPHLLTFRSPVPGLPLRHWR